MHIIENLRDNAGICIFGNFLLFLLVYMIIYSLLDSLLKMHRSKTAVKKLKKEYRFLQKIWLVPFHTHCLHAVKFCKFLILFQRTYMLCFAAYLSFALFFFSGLVSGTLLAWLTASIFVCFAIPPAIIHFSLTRPLIGRFKKYSFEKYHNTDNHHSLF